MKWTIEISDDNAAFDDSPATELARILITLSHRVLQEGTLLPLLHPSSLEGAILDFNGNTCGSVTVSGECRT